MAEPSHSTTGVDRSAASPSAAVAMVWEQAMKRLESDRTPVVVLSTQCWDKNDVLCFEDDVDGGHFRNSYRQHSSGDVVLVVSVVMDVLPVHS